MPSRFSALSLRTARSLRTPGRFSSRTPGRALRRGLAVLLTASALVTAPGLAPVSAAGPKPRDVGATATFEDNFDGPAGSAVDGGKWQIETGDNVNNHERQYYT
ncbi:hypothetical protein ACFVZ2_33070, partial [Streptomyces lasiicapitis]